MRNMPARNPEVSQRTEEELAELGQTIRARRRDLGISAVTTAEAAGMSRVTLYRIESGSPAVTIGAYMNAAAALGLRLSLGGLQRQPEPAREAAPVHVTPGALVRIGDYPKLREAAWQLGEDTELDEVDALALYERNWRHLDHHSMSEGERAFVRHLVDTHGGGVLLV